jgi:precorrin-3B methylase
MSRALRRNGGSLVCVGVGITLGSHLTPLARSHIEQADVVFVAASDGIVEKWLETMNRDVRSLQPLYAKGKPRMRTYREMVEAMLTEVRAGKKVCTAFYGHPGVFAWAPHRALALARKEGYFAHMEPGISAEDCLYADLGIDPGAFGCQHHEASQLLYYKRNIDTGAYLVVWQAGLIASQSVEESSKAHLQILAERLAQDYPPSHKVTIYRAATLPIHAPRIERTTLRKLAAARIEPPDTLVLPPARKLVADTKTLRRLDALAPSLR